MLPLGCKVHPRLRLLRILRDLLIKRRPAVATVTQRAVSGQASFAGRAVRKAHSESQADRPGNECIHFPVCLPGFLLPGNSPGVFQVTGGYRLFPFSSRFAGMGPGPKQALARDEPPMTACGGYFIGGEISRNEQCPHEADLRRLRLRNWGRAAPSVSLSFAMR